MATPPHPASLIIQNCKIDPQRNLIKPKATQHVEYALSRFFQFQNEPHLLHFAPPLEEAGCVLKIKYLQLNHTLRNSNVVYYT